MKRIALVSLCVLVAGGTSIMAMGQATTAKPVETEKSSKGNTSHTATGVVESIDAAKGSVMLAHDPVKSLNWPAMTMGFKVSDPKLLGKVKKGDKIQFTFVQSGKDFVITSIQ